MAVRTKVQSVDRDVKLISDQLLSPKAQAKQFADAAQQLLDEADAENRKVLGRIPPSKTWVDGRQGAALESVRGDGVIVREYELIVDVLLFIGDELRASSPVGKGSDRRPGHPGFYRASHTLFADGTEVNVDETIPDAGQYVFLSDVPYARKVERNAAVYENTAAKASNRFGNVAKIYFSWRAPVSGELVGGSKGNKSGSRFPAIVVTMGN